jgi:hypothetical protein
MKKMWPWGAFLGLAIVVAVGVLLASTRSNALAGAKEEDKAGGAGGAHYTVVMTEGHNLLVTDNATSKLYFYTIDKDAPLGSPLKLRASLDLTKVGQEEIRITAHNLEKFEPKK